MRRGAAAAAAILVAVAGAATALLAGRGRTPGPAARGPDIVVLLWDTCRADRLSAYGYARETSPWLASVARDGVLFEQCRAPSPWTLPSHASIFTGLLPRAHGALGVESPLAPSHATLAERLRDAGYDTLLLSNNSLVSPMTGLAQGFGTYVDVGTARGGPGAAATLEALRAELARRRADPARASRPVFLFVNLMEAHLPYDPPGPLERPWRPAAATDAQVSRLRSFEFPREVAHDLGIEVLPPEDVGVLSSLYDAEIRDLDDHGPAFEALLREEGILGPGAGILVVTSDHGENLGEHGLLDHKLSVAETLLHVPLVIRAPGRFEGGRRVREQVRLQDLFPTLLEAAGLAPDPAATPRAASLSGPVAARAQVAEFAPPLAYLPRVRETFPGRPEEVFEPFRRGLVAAVLPAEAGRRLKWVRTRRVPPEGPEEEVGESLFDLAADPGEERDLLAGTPAEADAAAAARMRALAEEALAGR